MPRKGQKLTAAQRQKIGEGQRRAYRERAKQPIVPLDRKPCSKCGKVQAIGEFPVIRKKLKSGNVAEYAGSWCRRCKAAYSKRVREKLKKEGLLRARQKRYEENEDPERRKARRREWENARRREEGRPMGRRSVQPSGAGQRLDCKPLIELLVKELRLEEGTAGNQHNSKGLQRLAESSGVAQRRIYGLLHGEYEQVALSTADRLLTTLGLTHMLPILYPEDP